MPRTPRPGPAARGGVERAAASLRALDAPCARSGAGPGGQTGGARRAARRSRAAGPAPRASLGGREGAWRDGARRGGSPARARVPASASERSGVEGGEGSGCGARRRTRRTRVCCRAAAALREAGGDPGLRCAGAAARADAGDGGLTRAMRLGPTGALDAHRRLCKPRPVRAFGSAAVRSGRGRLAASVSGRAVWVRAVGGEWSSRWRLGSRPCAAAVLLASHGDEPGPQRCR